MSQTTMSNTKERANDIIGYLLQATYERARMLREDGTGSKEAERHANIIHSLASSIAILREAYNGDECDSLRAKLTELERALEIYEHDTDYKSAEQGCS